MEPTQDRHSSKVSDSPKRKQRGRFAVLNSFADCGARSVDTTAQACWWILYRETKPNGLARVSQARIAECVGLGRVAVNRALKRLEQAKLLTVVRRGGLHGGPSTYRVYGTPRCIADDTPPYSADDTGGVSNGGSHG